jgi:hypothetical protein
MEDNNYRNRELVNAPEKEAATAPINLNTLVEQMHEHNNFWWMMLIEDQIKSNRAQANVTNARLYIDEMHKMLEDFRTERVKEEEAKKQAVTLPIVTPTPIIISNFDENLAAIKEAQKNNLKAQIEDLKAFVQLRNELSNKKMLRDAEWEASLWMPLVDNRFKYHPLSGRRIHPPMDPNTTYIG